MRVIAGEFKGRRLNFLKNPRLRPTMDRVKESVFNVLGGVLEEKRVLDVFSGCGSLGVEALSRGAEEAYFIDSSKEAVAILKKNIEELGLFQKRAHILIENWKRGLALLKTMGLQFELVFLDPPYKDFSVIQNVLMAMGDFDILRPLSRVVVEHSAQADLGGEKLSHYRRYRELHFGGTQVSFFEYLGRP